MDQPSLTSLPSRPFLRRELMDRGFSEHQLDRARTDDVLRRPLRGVYLPTPLDDDPAMRARAAALILPPHYVVSDRSAAWIHGVNCFGPGEAPSSAALEVVAVGGADRSRHATLMGGKRALVPDEICEIDGVRVTTPLRTACDIACLRGRGRALAVLDQFRRAYGLEAADFANILPRYRGRRGVVQLRELVQHSTPLAESPAESWTRMMMIDAGLPSPQLQTAVYLDDFGWVRLDLAYEDLKICIEYDGVEFHTAERDRARDTERRTALREAGWIVVVVRKDGLRTSGQDAWLSHVADAIASRSDRSLKRVYSRGESSPTYRHLRAIG